MSLSSYDEIEYQFESIERQMSDPDVIGDQQKYKECTQKYAELKPEIPEPITAIFINL